jgi:hypothetical protein
MRSGLGASGAFRFTSSAMVGGSIVRAERQRKLMKMLGCEPMIRRLLTLTSAMSLLLCAATVLLWFDTRSGIERFTKFEPMFGWDVFVGGGRAAVTWYVGDARVVASVLWACDPPAVLGDLGSQAPRRISPEPGQYLHSLRLRPPRQPPPLPRVWGSHNVSHIKFALSESGSSAVEKHCS